MTDAQVSKLVAALAAAFPAAKGDSGTVVIYQRMLKDLEYAAAHAAIERLIATSKWLPTIAEIREACLAITAGPRSPGGEAWGTTLRAIRSYGAYRALGVDFNLEDPIAQRCALALGWQELCLSENQTADRARFIELYDRLASEHRHSQLSENLPAMQRFRAIQGAQQSALEAGIERPQIEQQAPTDVVRDASEYTVLLAKLTGALTAESRADPEKREAWCARCDGPQPCDETGCLICKHPQPKAAT